jgi:hypothetical protein
MFQDSSPICGTELTHLMFQVVEIINIDSNKQANPAVQQVFSVLYAFFWVIPRRL